MDRVLDVSNLPAPEPLERTLDAVCKLSQGDRLLLRHRRQPFPLYDMLRRMGYRWQVPGEDGDWRGLIEPVSASSAADSDHSP